MANLKNSNDNLCWKGYGIKESCLHCSWEGLVLPATLEINMVSFQKSEIHQPNDPAISLLGTPTKDVKSYHKDTYSPMFLSALFKLARTWKLPRCQSTKE